jgi:hypothetical protein
MRRLRLNHWRDGEWLVSRNLLIGQWFRKIFKGSPGELSTRPKLLAHPVMVDAPGLCGKAEIEIGRLS